VPLLSVAISLLASASEPFALKLPPMKNLLRRREEASVRNDEVAGRV
jgi:hypothetical protein